MNAADKPRFLAVLTGLAAIKPGAKLTPEGLDLYWSAMESWELTEFEHAAAQLVRSCEFFPNPFHFEQLRKATLPTAAETWSRVTSLAVMEHSRRERELEECPLPAIALRIVQSMGGWHFLAMADADKRHFRERRFGELWSELSQVDEARAALLPSTSNRTAIGVRASGDVLLRMTTQRELKQ